MPDRPPRQWQLNGFEEWLAAEQLAGYGDIELIVWIWIHARAHSPLPSSRSHGQCVSRTAVATESTVVGTVVVREASSISRYWV